MGRFLLPHQQRPLGLADDLRSAGFKVFGPSAAAAELEREHLFKKAWLHVARENEIPNPGDFITRDIERRFLEESLASYRDPAKRLAEMRGQS